MGSRSGPKVAFSKVHFAIFLKIISSTLLPKILIKISFPKAKHLVSSLALIVVVLIYSPVSKALSPKLAP